MDLADQISNNLWTVSNVQPQTPKEGIHCWLLLELILIAGTGPCNRMLKGAVHCLALDADGSYIMAA